MPVEQVPSPSLASDVSRIALATALGLFLGLEREWAEKSAGIRTFALISLLAAGFTVIDRPALLAIGAVLVVGQGVLLAVRGIVADEAAGLSLTTSASMLLAYAVGALVADGHVTVGVTVTVLSALLLVLKRDLHRFAGGLTREELRSTTEFAILAFVIYPLLPTGSVPVGLGSVVVEVEARVAWLMVVTVAGIGIGNYAIVNTYGGRGIAITGFFGGLASSMAVVGTMLDHVRQHPDATSYALAAILLANAAMALRNLAITVAFTVSHTLLVGALLPLGTVVVGAVAIAAYAADWREDVSMSLESPFSLRNALAFGAVFAVILVVGSLAEAELGETGLYLTAAISGLVSSAGATTSAVVLYRTGSIDDGTAVVAILLATATSIAVKAAVTALGPDRRLASRVVVWSGVLLLAAAATTVLSVL